MAAFSPGLFEILLMVLLCRPEDRGRDYLCHNLPTPEAGGFLESLL